MTAVDLSPFPASQARIIRDLINQVQECLTIAKRNPAVPIVQATGTAGFFLPNVSTPSTPSGGCKLYAVSGTLRILESDGTVREIPDPVTPGATVTYPRVFESPATITGTPSAANFNDLRGDTASLRSAVTSIIASLEGNDVISGHTGP